MTGRESKAARNRRTSLDAFLAQKVQFDALLADLRRMRGDHFGADPEVVLWGEIGSLRDCNHRLRQITDASFKRGEYAA